MGDYLMMVAFFMAGIFVGVLYGALPMVVFAFLVGTPLLMEVL